MQLRRSFGEPTTTSASGLRPQASELTIKTVIIFFMATKLIFSRRQKSVAGFTAITIIMGITLIVTVLSISMGLLSYLENATSLSRFKGQEAFLVAESGAYDAMYRLAMDKDFVSLGYNLSVGNGQATIYVEKDSPQAGFSLITSTGLVGNARKRIQLKVIRDDQTGKLTILSWQELAI
ncbi:MAG: hypothetical protein UX26_C0015G0003 [Parcubacteria group bacterium GW2011_GWC1_45_9]|nr:MAG: hypothetical protein UX26_C0015G0003 [Parcubacteria group bacterium GW2011_GWC1_45_9]